MTNPVLYSPLLKPFLLMHPEKKLCTKNYTRAVVAVVVVVVAVVVVAVVVVVVGADLRVLKDSGSKYEKVGRRWRWYYDGRLQVIRSEVLPAFDKGQ